MLEELKVKKWWGENAAELTKSPENIIKDFRDWIKQVVVVSAIRSPEFNTTDYLIKLWELLSVVNIDKEQVNDLLLEIKNFHLSVVLEKIEWNIILLNEFIDKKFDELEDNINYFIDSVIDSVIDIKPSKENDYLINTSTWKKSILWFWESLSAEIHSFIINNLNIEWLESQTVNLENKDNDSLENVSDVFANLSKNISERISNILDNNKVPVVSWYISWFEKWIEKTIWRGYTDATSSMLAVWLSKKNDVVLEIQKSVRWMLSADPRVVNWNTKVIEEIDYLTAKEIVWTRWAQAKLLHCQVLRNELQEAWIKIHLFDPFNDTWWTIISKNKSENSKWVEFIWWKEWITFFSISSSKMCSRWIIAKIFWIVKNYTSVDIISTSETEVSFTLDSKLCKKKLEKMTYEIMKILWIKENGNENFVKYKENKALVFCVWQNLSNTEWSLARASYTLYKWWINVEMLSQWIMERAIVFWIEWNQMNNAVNLLHEEFID